MNGGPVMPRKRATPARVEAAIQYAEWRHAQIARAWVALETDSPPETEAITVLLHCGNKVLERIHLTKHENGSLQ